MYTLGEAAKHTGFSKSTLSRAIKNGSLSANRLDDKSYAIEPAELNRWVDSNSHRNSDLKRIQTPEKHLETPPSDTASQAEIEGLRQQVQLLKSERDDLRRRLDDESEERRKLTAMLTDQRTQPPPKRGFWTRITGR